MQVKKFEAKSIKEALAMVKAEFGPDAVILSAKDMGSSHGLVGEKSVQVTAAVSEKKLQKKAYAEKTLSKEMLGQFKNASATSQKSYIDELLEGLAHKNNSPISQGQQNIESLYNRPRAQRTTSKSTYNRSRQVQPRTRNAHLSADRPVRATQYIDILDDEATKIQTPSRPAVRQPQVSQPAARQTVRPREIEADGIIRVVEPIQQAPQIQTKADKKQSREVLDLKKQIQQLKSLVENFQKVPQNFVSMHPGASEGIPYELSSMHNKLSRYGFAEEHIVSILKEANEKLSKKQMQHSALLDAWVAQHLMQNIYISSDPLKKKYQVFVGGSGQGKTSSLIKVAAMLSLENKKSIAIITTDNSKVGAAEQLKIYAQILNVPFAQIEHGSDWSEVYKAVEHIDHVLVDTPSCQINDHDSIIDLKSKLPNVKDSMDIHYVQSLLSRVEDAFDRAQTYLGVGFNDVLFTHIDESSQYGLIYNFQKRFEVPIHSFSTGPKIPEDYEFATREKYVDLIFNLSSRKK